MEMECNQKKPIIIVGAGGLGREIAWMIHRINEFAPAWELLGYTDDGILPGTMYSGVTVLGNVNSLLDYEYPVSVICAIASVEIRRKIVQKLKQSTYLDFPNLIDPSAILSEQVEIGIGNIICAQCILTVDIQVGDFNIFNNQCTIGHDAKLSSFVTLYPAVNISGNVIIEQETEIGTGSQIIQGKRIGEGAIVGAGSVVINHIPPYATAVGCPASPIKFKKKGNIQMEIY